MEHTPLLVWEGVGRPPRQGEGRGMQAVRYSRVFSTYVVKTMVMVWNKPEYKMVNATRAPRIASGWHVSFFNS